VAMVQLVARHYWSKPFRVDLSSRHQIDRQSKGLLAFGDHRLLEAFSLN